MSALDSLAALGLSLQADGDKLKISGLSSLSKGQADYAFRLANAHKAEIVRDLNESQKALEELLAHLSQAPGVRLHFFALEPVPAYSLQFDEGTSTEDFIEAQRLFFRANDAIHFNATSVADRLKPGGLFPPPPPPPFRGGGGPPSNRAQRETAQKSFWDNLSDAKLS